MTFTLTANLFGTATITVILTDSDSGALTGMAVVGVTGSRDGRWSSNGTRWKPIGLVSLANALLLTDTDRVRFLPNPHFAGTATLTFHAWDRTRGTAGQRANLQLSRATGSTTSFSAANETAAATILPIDDAPMLNVEPVVSSPRSFPAILTPRAIRSLSCSERTTVTSMSTPFAASRSPS